RSMKAGVAKEDSNCASRDACMRSRLVRQKSVLDGRFKMANFPSFRGRHEASRGSRGRPTILHEPDVYRTPCGPAQVRDPDQYAGRSAQLLPVGAFGIGVQKPPIGDQMLFVIGRERRICGGLVGHIRVKRWFLHESPATHDDKRYDMRGCRWPILL